MSTSDEDFAIVRGTGNVFSDLGLPNADVELAKADLAAAIMRAQREQSLTNAAAAEKAGIDVGDMSRIRNCDLDRFTIDRLTRIARSLDPQVHIVIARIPEPTPAHG